MQQEWPEMAHQRADLSPLATHFFIEALDNAFALKPADESQQSEPEMIRALRTALDARRQRIVISRFPWRS